MYTLKVHRATSMQKSMQKIADLLLPTATTQCITCTCTYHCKYMYMYFHPQHGFVFYVVASCEPQTMRYMYDKHTSCSMQLIVNCVDGPHRLLCIPHTRRQTPAYCGTLSSCSGVGSSKSSHTVLMPSSELAICHFF